MRKATLLIRSTLLIAAATSLVACSSTLDVGNQESQRPGPTQVEPVDVVEPTERETPTILSDECADILSAANANQDAALENELERCLEQRLTPIASTAGGSDCGALVEDPAALAQCVLDELAEAGIDLPNLDECQPLLDDGELEEFAECVAEALWEDADLPELEDECLDLLEAGDAAAAEAFADCVADQLGDADVPMPAELPCVDLLEAGDHDAFAECIADEIEDRIEAFDGPCGEVLTGEDGCLEDFLACLGDEADDGGIPEDAPCADEVEAAEAAGESPLSALIGCVGELLGEEEPAAEPPADMPCLDALLNGEGLGALEDFAACLDGELPEEIDLPEEPCAIELDEAISTDTDAAWDAFDACLDDQEGGLAACFDILDDQSLSDEEAFDAFDLCVDGL